MQNRTQNIKITDITDDSIKVTAEIEEIMTGLTYTAHCTFPYILEQGDKYVIHFDFISGAHKILPPDVRQSLVGKVLDMLNY